MAPRITLIAAFAIITAVNQLCVLAVTQTDEEKAITGITQLIKQFSGQNSTIENPAAKLVRLIFHDCAESGCDGCLNITSSGNSGLMPIYTALNSLYDGNDYVSMGISRADLIVLAATVAVRLTSLEQDCTELGLETNCLLPMPNITLKYGRKDCSTSPFTDVVSPFPNAHLGLSHVLEYFADNVGNYTTRDTVAIIGAHTLGQTRFQNTGFNGLWTFQPTRFDNGFYRELVSTAGKWVQNENNNTQSPFYPNSTTYQWDKTTNGGSATVMMLNADICFYRDIAPSSDSNSFGLEQNVSCRADSSLCPLSSTANTVIEFAQNNTAFMEAFGLAFQKLSENGYSTDQLMTAETDVAPDSAKNIHAIIFITVSLMIMSIIAV